MNTGPFRVLFVAASEQALPGVQAAVGDHSDFDLTTVQHTRKGRAAVDWEPVDCVLLSVPLQDDTAEAFVDEIRAAYPGVAIVLLVDSERKGALEVALAVDVDDYVRHTPGETEGAIIRDRVRSSIERQRTRAELRRQRDFLERTQRRASVGGWEYTPARGHLRWTEQVYDIYGVPAEFEPTIEGSLEYVHTEDQGTLRTAMSDLLRRQTPYALDLRLVTPDETVKWVHVTGDPHVVGDDVRTVRGTIRDVTALVERQSELARLKTELEDESGRLGELARILAHELRNPLAGAQGQLSVYQESGDSAHLDAIERNLTRLETIVDDVVWLVSDDSVLGDVTMVQVADVAQTVWDEVHSESIAFEAEPFEAIPADESLLETLFEKLFENVRDHAHATTVRVGPCYDSGTLTGFYVADDGTGFPESDADPADLGVSFSGAGTGVGLAVTHDIVERHGWLMCASTAADGGARIDITTDVAGRDAEVASTVEGE